MTKRYLGLDLGGTYIKIAVIEEAPDGVRPTVVYSDKVRTGGAAGPEHVLDRLIAQGLKAFDLHGPFVGVGIGVPGLFDQATGSIELLPNLPGPWEGFLLRDPIGDGLGMPATMINDARAFTLAEGTVGAGRGASVMLGVTLGTGIGGGIMIDGKLHLGAFGFAGEFGHQTVDPTGPICGCGNRGCLEAVAKGSTIAAAAGVKNAEAAYAAAAAGDQGAIEATESAAFFMAIAIANVVTVVGVDTVVLGGGIMSAGDQVLQPLEAALAKRLTLVSAQEVTLVKAALGGHAGAIGAALAARVAGQTRSR
ncbi:MAG: ROK family protein [Actinomycetota bacterium]|nr:ROK family protein [Actinomycetota bacterium]